MAPEKENTLRVSLTVGGASFEAEGPPDQVRELYEQFRDGVVDRSAAAPKAKPPSPPAGSGDAVPEAPKPPDGLSGGDASDDGAPDEDVFYSRLADETDVPVDDLRQVLHVDGGEVKLLGAARLYGESRAEQGRTMAALAVGARYIGFGEHPVDNRKVRAALDRRNALDSNYSKHVIGELAGANFSGRTELVVNPRCVPEFQAAVRKVLKKNDGE